MLVQEAEPKIPMNPLFPDWLDDDGLCYLLFVLFRTRGTTETGVFSSELICLTSTEM